MPTINGFISTNPVQFLNITPEAGFGETSAPRLVYLLRLYHFGWPEISTEVTVHEVFTSNRLAVHGHITQRYVRNGYPTPTLPPNAKCQENGRETIPKETREKNAGRISFFVEFDWLFDSSMEHMQIPDQILQTNKTTKFH